MPGATSSVRAPSTAKPLRGRHLATDSLDHSRHGASPAQPAPLSRLRPSSLVGTLRGRASPARSLHFAVGALALVSVGSVAGVTRAAASTPGVPAPVITAVSKWAPYADGISTAQGKVTTVLRAIPEAVRACGVTEAREPIAASLSSFASSFLSETHDAEHATLPLYSLSRLFPNHATKEAYVTALDRVGTQLDKLLEVGKNIQTVASDFGSGNCSEAAGLASMTAATLTNDVATFQGAVARLLASYGT